MSDHERSLRTQTYEARCASPGMATGSVRIIESNITKIPAGPPQVDIMGTEAITPGDIVVVPTLLPELIDTVQMAGGLIFPTETALTGRGPVFARGEEIPAVVDCPVVATELEQGEQVTVDADEGEVTRY